MVESNVPNSKNFFDTEKKLLLKEKNMYGKNVTKRNMINEHIIWKVKIEYQKFLKILIVD